MKKILTVAMLCAYWCASGAEVTVLTEKGSGYNSWSFFSVVGKRIVCAYSRGAVHTTNERGRGTYVRCSDDAGETWRSEKVVAYSPEDASVVEGMGNDADGRALMWIREWKPGAVAHKLFRSGDGEKYEFVCEVKLDPVPTQVMDVVRLDDGKLMSMWFAGSYGGKKVNSWGTLTSGDNGRTWRQSVVERGLAKEDWPTEQSVVNIGGGRLLAIGRRESGGKDCVQFQLESDDHGVTWRKMRTNIGNIAESTPALVYDKETGIVSNYYFQRHAGVLWRRCAKVGDVWRSPTAWGDCEKIVQASKNSYHAGNVKAVSFAGRHFMTIYSGDKSLTDIWVVRGL